MLIKFNKLNSYLQQWEHVGGNIHCVSVFHMLTKIWRKFWQLYLEPSSPQNLLKSNDGNWPNLTGTKRIWLELEFRPCIQGYTLSNLGHNVQLWNWEDQQIQQGWFTGSIQLIKHLRAVEDTSLSVEELFCKVT